MTSAPKKKPIALIVGVIVALAAIGIGVYKMTATQKITIAPGLEATIVKQGSGAAIQKGQMAKVHYTGWLTDNTKFDSSKDRNEPFEFQIGGMQVIRGWDLGVEGMKVGEVRKLNIAPELGYGEQGAGTIIPPNSTLVFEVELIGIN